jgi:hypothetical protein
MYVTDYFQIHIINISKLNKTSIDKHKQRNERKKKNIFCK